MKKAWGPYADEMIQKFRPVQQEEIPQGPETEELSLLPDFKPWTGTEKLDWTETDAWLAKQKGGYGPSGIDNTLRGGGRGEGVMMTADLLGGRRKKSKRGKSKSKRGKSKSKRGKSKSKSKSK